MKKNSILIHIFKRTHSHIHELITFPNTKSVMGLQVPPSPDEQKRPLVSNDGELWIEKKEDPKPLSDWFPLDIPGNSPSLSREKLFGDSKSVVTHFGGRPGILLWIPGSLYYHPEMRYGYPGKTLRGHPKTSCKDPIESFACHNGI